MPNKQRIIVNLATSADGYIARPDGDIEWLTRRPAPKGFYGLSDFERSIDTKLLGRKTFDIDQVIIDDQTDLRVLMLPKGKFWLRTIDRDSNVIAETVLSVS